MVRTVSLSETRLLSDPRPVRRPEHPPAGGPLGFRPVAPQDLPWVQSWTSQLRLPAPVTQRVRSFVLIEADRRVGYLAARLTAFNTGAGREPVMWIVSAFLIPSHRRRGLLPRFCELLSRAHYPGGKTAARIAAGNAAMHRFMARGGWRQIRRTARYSDYLLEFSGPYRAMTRG
jgi:hypothetical protein